MDPNFTDFNMYHLMVLCLAAFVYAIFDADGYMKKVTAWFENRKKE